MCHRLCLHMPRRRHILNDNWQPFCLQCFKNLSCSIRTFVVSDNQQIGKTKRVAHKALDNIHFVLYHRDRDDFFSSEFDSLLCLNALLIRMLDEMHLCHEVGTRDDFWRSIAPRQHDMKRLWPQV